jgi:hypothetical protein
MPNDRATEAPLTEMAITVIDTLSQKFRLLAALDGERESYDDSW